MIENIKGSKRIFILELWELDRVLKIPNMNNLMLIWKELKEIYDTFFSDSSSTIAHFYLHSLKLLILIMDDNFEEGNYIIDRHYEFI